MQQTVGNKHGETNICIGIRQSTNRYHSAGVIAIHSWRFFFMVIWMDHHAKILQNTRATNAKSPSQKFSHQRHLEEKINNVKGSANDLPWWIPTPILVLIIIPMIILQRGHYCHNSSRNIPWYSDWLTNPHDIPIATPCFSWLSHDVTLFLHIFQHQPKIPAACARPW